MKAKRVRPYTKHVALGKDCQVCGAPIFGMRLGRAATAVACSHECLHKYHARRLRERPARKAKYRAERHINTGGYVMLNINRLEEPVQSFVRQLMPKSNYAQEHRIVMMRALGRTLRKNESVHHKDGNKQNNAIENLELWLGAHGTGVRAGDIRCAKCGEVYA